MSKIDFKTIYPGDLANSFNPSVGICAKKLQLVLDKEQIPKIGTNSFQNKKIGTIVVKGSIEDLSFCNTATDNRAYKTDALAIYFSPDVTYPNNGDIILNNIFKEVIDYFDLPTMIKLFITGIEQTLLRRVVAIGQEISDSEKEIIYKWIPIPKVRFQSIPVENKEILT